MSEEGNNNFSVGMIDYTKHPVDNQDLTADGIQWSAEVDTTTANVDVVIFTDTIQPPLGGIIDSLELGFTAAFKAVSTATADLIWKWQIKNSSASSWIDLHAAVTETNINTTYVERTRQGYFSNAALTKVPFDIRLILQANELNEGRAKVKNSSYVKVIYNSR